MAAVPKFRRTHSFEIYEHQDGALKGKFDIRIRHTNGNVLVSSSQGYENRADAVQTVRGIVDAVFDGTLVIEDQTHGGSQ